VVDWEFFRIDDDYYLAAASAAGHVTSSSDQVSGGSTGSSVYRLDKVRKQFDLYQDIDIHRLVALWTTHVHVHTHTTENEFN